MISTRLQIQNLERAQHLAGEWPERQAWIEAELQRLKQPTPMDELRKELNRLALLHDQAKKEGDEDRMINLSSAMADILNKMEKQADASNAMMHMLLRKALPLN